MKTLNELILLADRADRTLEYALDEVDAILNMAETEEYEELRNDVDAFINSNSFDRNMNILLVVYFNIQYNCIVNIGYQDIIRALVYIALLNNTNEYVDTNIGRITDEFFDSNNCEYSDSIAVIILSNNTSRDLEETISSLYREVSEILREVLVNIDILNETESY